MRPPVDRGARVAPGAEHRVDGAAQLLARVVGQRAAVLGREPAELGAQRAQVVGVEVGVAADAAIRLLAAQRMLVDVARHALHHLAVHLHEAAVRVPGEARVARLGGQRLGGRLRHAEVEDRVHHPRHRVDGAGAHRHQQRPSALAQLAARALLEGDQSRPRSRPRGRRATPVPRRRDAGLGGDGEPVGTGTPMRSISATFAPLPPSSDRMSADPSLRS